MKIRKHSESHIVELDDGSQWQIFPGDLDLTLRWEPETNLELVPTSGEISSHVLFSVSDNTKVRVLPSGKQWPVGYVRDILKDG